VGGLLIVGTNLPSVLRAFTGLDIVIFRREYILIISGCVFLPLAFFKNISNYAINSFLSIMSLIALEFIVLYKAIAGGGNSGNIPAGALNIFGNGQFLSALGGTSFLFVCHDIQFSVFSSFENATRKRWSIVVYLTMVLTIVTFLFLGYTGYFMFYTNVYANILDNFPQNDIPANVARILLSLNVMMSVPYMCFMPRISLYAIITLFFGKLNRTFFHVCFTILIITLGVLIAEVVTDLGALFEIIGGISAVGLAYIMPPLIFLRLEKGSLLSPKKIIHIIILVFGVIAMFGSVIQTIYCTY